METSFDPSNKSGHSGQLVRQDPQKLVSSAPIIILAKVSKVTLAREEGIHGREYSVSLTSLSQIKGGIRDKEILLRTSQGGTIGFDLSYKVGDVGVFFFESVEKGKGKLLSPGSVAFFDKSYFQD